MVDICKSMHENLSHDCGYVVAIIAQMDVEFGHFWRDNTVERQ